MIARRIQRVLLAISRPASAAGMSGDDKQLAMAALLVEAAAIDTHVAAAERSAIARLLQKKFDLKAADLAELTQAAVAAQKRASDLVGFTRVIKDGCTAEERLHFLEMLWEIVLADGRIDSFEDNLLRRIGGLLYISDRERGEARRRVQARLRGPAPHKD